MMTQGVLFGLGDAGGASNAHTISPRRHRSAGSKNARPRETILPVGDHGWTLEPHICRRCLGGRLLSRPGQKMRAYCCSNCGDEREAAGPEVLCFCGMTVQRHGASVREVDLGVRCHANPAPTPEFPSVIVASEKPKIAEK